MDLHERTVSCNGIKNPDGGFIAVGIAIFWQNILDVNAFLTYCMT